MNIDQKTLNELKTKLQNEKIRIEEELNRIAKPTRSNGDYTTSFNNIGTDEDENASEVEEYADNLALEANLHEQLKEILEALERINAGTFGFCENCNAAISIERLMAYPAARKCLNC